MKQNHEYSFNSSLILKWKKFFILFKICIGTSIDVRVKCSVCRLQYIVFHSKRFFNYYKQDNVFIFVIPLCSITWKQGKKNQIHMLLTYIFLTDDKCAGYGIGELKKKLETTLRVEIQ